MTRDHAILGTFADISVAREALHMIDDGQYVARIDGTVMAYMSREGQSWRPIAKVPPEIKPRLATAVASDL